MSESSNTLDDLRHSRDRAVLALEAAQADAALRVLKESNAAGLTEAWGDRIDPIAWLNDDASFLSPHTSASYFGGSDGRSGRTILSNEHELAAIRAAARFLTDSLPTAAGILKNLTNYCIGTGFSYKAIERIPSTTGREQNDLVEAVGTVIDEFLEDNDWIGDFERELFSRSRRDGEFFLALYPRPSGRVVARVIEPEQVTEPQNARGLEDWLQTESASSWAFGVHTDSDDVQAVRGYHVLWNESGSDWDYLPADSVEHVKLNVDRNVKRGLSDFYAVRAHLEGAEKLLRNTREGAAVQAAIAFIREHVPGTTEGQIQSLPASTAATNYSQQTKTGARTRYVSRYEPGTVLDVAGGMQYKPGPLGSAHAPNFIAIEQAVLRAIGVRWCMPEYMISGDASNANYSSSLVAESPFVKACQAEQRFYKSRFRRILWKVIRIAADAGRFAHWNIDFETIKQFVALQIEAPTVSVRDQLSEARASEIENQNGVLSKRTWTALAGRNFDDEQKNLMAERDALNEENDREKQME